MDAGLAGKWPVLERHERAAEWLGIWADLGRAPRTIDAYSRGLAEYLESCERGGTDPLAATRADVAAADTDPPSAAYHIMQGAPYMIKQVRRAILYSFDVQNRGKS